MPIYDYATKALHEFKNNYMNMSKFDFMTV